MHILLKVENIDKSIKDLESEVGFTCRGYMEGTTSVPKRLQLDEKKLKKYLNWALKLHSKGEKSICHAIFIKKKRRKKKKKGWAQK